MQTNSCGNKLKPSKSYRDSEDAAAKEGVGNESEFKSKVFYSEEKKRSSDSSSFIRSSSHTNSSAFPTIVVCQRESKPLGRSRGRSRDDFRMARGASVAERRGGGGNGISGSSANVRGRGAGGMSRKAMERETDSGGVGGFIPRGKFQESLSKSSSSDVLSSGSSNLSKNVNEMEGNKGRSDCYFTLPEDARISKLIRRLNREDDPEKCISITKQLQEAFQNSENGRYIRRSVDLIADSLIEVLRRGPGSDARLQAARCLGRLGYALDSDFKRFSEWLFNKYSTERGEEVRRLLMIALLETLKVDARSGGDGENKGDGSLVKLKDLSGHLMSQLQTALENTWLPELLIATVDVLLFLAKLCPAPFTKHFRDTVDILVGWHIDGGQPHWVCTYASQTLRKLQPFWLNDLGFSVNLLAQFIEDVEAFGEDLLHSESGRSSPEDKPPSSPEDLVFRITQLIKVFNTVVRSLGEGLTPAVPPAPQSPVTWPFLVDGLQKVLKAVHSALSPPTTSHQNYEDLLVSANECVSLLLSLVHSRLGTSVIETLQTFLFSQITLTPSLSHPARVSMLGTITKTVREVSSNLPSQLVPALISPIPPDVSPLLELRFSASCPGNLDCPCRTATSERKGAGGEGEMLLAVHHALLSLKNVPLLQEAYRFVLMELEGSYVKLVPSASLLSTTSASSNVEPVVNIQDEAEQLEKAQIIVLYQLRALSDLANASNSIIGMWALKPSILELLAVRMQCHNQRLAMKWPHIQRAIVYLLRSHCHRYNHFVSSSSLVGAGSGGSVIGGPTEVGGLVVPSGSSPTSGHLSTILQLLAKILHEPETGEPTRLLVLRWSQEVIAQCNPYLYGKNGSVWHGHGTEFSDFLWALVLSSRTHKRHIAQAVLAAMATLLDANSSSVRFSGESWCSKVLPPEMVPFIVDMCLQHLDWPEPALIKLQPLLLRILPHLPWPVALPVLLSRLTAAAPCRILSSNDVGSAIQSSVSPQKDFNHLTGNGPDMPEIKDSSVLKVKKNDSRQLCMSTVKTWRTVMCDGACRGTFGGEMHPTHFRPFMAYLLQGIQHSEKNWLSQAFASCWPLQHGQGSFEGNLRNSIVAALTGKKGVEGRLEDQSMALELALSSEATLLSWAAHQAAHLCVRMKLRTPLGKPQDTFTSIESAIKNIAREGPHVLITQPRSEGNDQTLRGGIRKWLARTQPLARRAMVLLDFLEQLEKAAYNAWEGSAVSMTPPPKPVRMFFRTNKSTCAEWLGRIRWASMTVAVQRTTHGAPAHALRHGQMMLTALAEAANTRSSEFERCVLYVAWSLCMLGEPEAIVGLQAWCNSVVNASVEGDDITSGMKFSWLKAMSHQAAGRYEAALRDYMAVIDENENFELDEGKSEHIDSHVMAFLHKQVEECYCSLQAWDAAMLWSEKDNHMVDNHCGWLYERKSRAVLKVLSNFPSSIKNDNMLSKNSLDDDKDDRGSDEETGFEDLIWEKYGLNNGIIGSASSTVGRVESVLQGIALILAKEGTKITDAVKLSLIEEVEGCEKALQIHLREGLFSNPSNFIPESCVLQFAASGLHSVLEGKSGTYLFDLSGSDILNPGLGSSLLLRLLWWSHFFSADLENDAVISRLRICAAKAARWEGNFNLCERLLEKEMKVHNSKKVLILENLHVTAEHAKFLQYTGSHIDAVNLASKTCLEICKAFSEKPTSESSAVRDKCSRLLLSLSKWIQSISNSTEDSEALLSSPLDYVTSSPCLLELLNWEKNSTTLSLETTPPGFEQLAVDNSWKSGEMSESSEALPSLIRLGISICPGLAKGWATLGGWCYDMGRKTVEEISMPTAAGGNNIPMWLSDEEIAAAQSIFMPVPRTNMEILEACEFLVQKISEDESDVKDVISNLVSEFSSLSLDGKDQQLLESVSSDNNQEIPDSSSPKIYLSSLNEVQLSELWTLVRNALKRRYVHYEMAVAAYFRYLHLSGGDEEDKCKESAMNGSDATTRLMASLRLLRLVSSPHRAHIRLRPYLEHGVASTPVAPWVPLLPQLLSRLGHASTPPYARRALSGLLCRLPQHLVAFPAVVGATADSLTKAPGLRHPSGPKSGLHGKRNSLQETRDVAANDMFESSLSQSGDGNDAEMANDEKERVDKEEDDAEEAKVMDRGGVDEEDEEEDDDDEEDEEDGTVGEMQASVMKNCFQSIVDTLAKKNPECVAGVQTLVKELRRTTLLWDEAWSGLLAQQSTEAARRCSQAEAEAARTYANPRIIDPIVRDKIIMEKHRIIVAPVLWALEQLYSLTCVVPPETPHERRFRDRHGPLLTELLSRMRQPPDPRHPNESWLSLYHRIQASLRGGSSSGPPSLRMSEVSPVLAAMRGTAVAMPGASNATGNVITIEGVHEHVTILPTKTRPKKLVFYGSDGQKYTYLFKGLEDLHLDERIMQFLSVANTMMARASRKYSNLDVVSRGGGGWKDRGSLYRARHYSVTPLGPRAGLISWVEGATPLFGLYKRWQHRQAAATAAAAAAAAAKPPGAQSSSGQASSSSKSSAGNAGAPTGILRPSELFHSKLAPLLKERGIPVPVAPGPHGGGGYVPADGRRDWPPQVLRQVLSQLMEETPKDLLAKELWCRSANASAWWQATRTYAHSVAVMSIIGYVIGLGDRHLDNVLVDLETGEVVHIDYNVCFEKGRTLRVPEKVPFRMTPNLETALGVMGIEGTFRLACEHVLQTLQNGSETLLTLLEAFVYDPLVDWTPGNEAGYAGSVYGGGWSHRRPQGSAVLEGRQTRKEMEKELTKSMFIVRVQEMKNEWFANQDDLKDLLPQAKVQLEAWEAARSSYRSRAQTLQGWHHVLAALKDAEANCLVLTESEDTENKDESRNSSGDNTSNQEKALMVNGGGGSSSDDGENPVEKAKKGLMEAVQEWEAQEKLHQAALSSLFGQQLSLWMQEMQSFSIKEREGDEKSRESFDLVRGLLQSLGAVQTVAQCDQARADLWTARCRRMMLVHGCLDLLGQYSTLASFFPRSNGRSSPHRPICYARWANELLQDFTVETCHRLHSLASSLLMSPGNMNADLAAVISYRRSLQSSIAHSASCLEKVCVRLRVEKLDEADGNMTMTPLQACEDSRNAVLRFIATEGGLLRGGAAIQCVVLTALARLNRQFLNMESAAASAVGESLSTLCSRDGDWFLDEMCNVITTVTEIASVVDMDGAWGGEICGVGLGASTEEDIPQLRDALQCLHTAYGIFKALQDLNFNVRTIILPEALKSVIGEEPSVLMMMGLLDILERNLGADLTHHFGPDMDSTRSPTKRLLSVLQTHLQFVAIGAESPHSAAPGIAERLCRQFEEILRNDEEIVGSTRDQDSGMGGHGNMTPGQMLLMGFNGLFEKVQREGCVLADNLPSILPPRGWVESVDHLIESEALLAPMLRTETRDTQETLLHAQRVYAIREFFSLCQSAADAFRSEGSSEVSEAEQENEEERLCMPVKVFTANAVQGLLIGSITRSISMAICIIIHKSLGINVNETIKEMGNINSENFSGSSKRVSLDDLCGNAVEVCRQRESQGLQPSTPTQLSSSPLLSPSAMLALPIGSPDAASSAMIQAGCLPGVASTAILPMTSNSIETISHHELTPPSVDPAVLLAYTSEPLSGSSMVSAALPPFPTLPNMTGDSEVDASHNRSAEELTRGDGMRLFSVLPVSNVMNNRLVSLVPSFPHSLLTVASALLHTFQTHCNRLALQRRLLRDAEWARLSLQRLRLQAAAHAWIHGSEDDGIESQRDSMSVNILSRPRFLNELRECVSALSAIEPCVMEASENYSATSNSAIQRLKWEQDTNPAFEEVISAFERELACGANELSREGSLSALLGSVGATLLHREGLRSGCLPVAPEAEAADSAFIRILNECETSITTHQQKLMNLTSSGDLSSVKPDMAALCKITDPSLLQITPDNFKDTSSIRAFEVHIAERIRGVQMEMGEAQVAMEAADDGVRRCASKIRSLLATHHRLMSDVRSLLKTMLKFEDVASTGLDAFLRLYRSYSESFASLLRTLLAPPGTAPPQDSPSVMGDGSGESGGVGGAPGSRACDEEDGSDGEDGDVMGGRADARRKRHALEQLHSLEAMTGRIYSGLVDLATQMVQSGSGQAGDSLLKSSKMKSGRPKLVRQDGICQSPVKTSTNATKVAPSPRGAKGGVNSVGERNAYALSVWKRVKMKLEGRDPCPSKKSSVAEQVDYVIQEATSLDNLSLLYEGWTPWV